MFLQTNRDNTKMEKELSDLHNTLKSIAERNEIKVELRKENEKIEEKLDDQNRILEDTNNQVRQLVEIQKRMYWIEQEREQRSIWRKIYLWITRRK